MNPVQQQLLVITRCFKNHLDINRGLDCSFQKNNSCASAQVCTGLNFIYQKGKEDGREEIDIKPRLLPEDDPSIPFEHCKLGYSANSCTLHGVSCNNCQENTDIENDEPGATENVEEAPSTTTDDDSEARAVAEVAKLSILEQLHKDRTAQSQLPNCPECSEKLVVDELNKQLLCTSCGTSIELLGL
jgi:hypothetical protein